LRAGANGIDYLYESEERRTQPRKTGAAEAGEENTRETGARKGRRKFLDEQTTRSTIQFYQQLPPVAREEIRNA